MAANEERNVYEITDGALERVKRAFTYHPPKGDQTQRCEEMRDAAAALALGIIQNTPECREQSLALTKLEEVVMWFNAAIARNE